METDGEEYAEPRGNVEEIGRGTTQHIVQVSIPSEYDVMCVFNHTHLAQAILA